MLDFCQKAPLEESFQVFREFSSELQYINNNYNLMVLLKAIVDRPDLDCKSLLECFSQYSQWDQIKGDYFKYLEGSGKSECLPQNTAQLFGTHPIHSLENKHSRFINRPEAALAHVTITPQPTPYPLDPIYLKNTEMMNEGLVRAFLAENDPARQESILDQMSFENLGQLQPYLFSNFVEKIGQTSSKAIVLGFLEKLLAVWNWNEPGIADSIIKLPYDDDPQVQKTKVELLLSLEETAGMNYIQNAWTRFDSMDRKELAMEAARYRYSQGPETSDFKAELLNFLLSVFRTEKEPFVRAALIETLAKSFSNNPQTIKVLRDYYSGVSEMTLDEASALTEFAKPDMVPLLLNAALFPSVESNAIQAILNSNGYQPPKELLSGLNEPLANNSISRWKELNGPTGDLIRKDFGISNYAVLVQENEKEESFQRKLIILKIFAANPKTFTDDVARAGLQYFYSAPNLFVADQFVEVLKYFPNRILVDDVEVYCQKHPDWLCLESGVKFVAQANEKKLSDVPFLKGCLSSKNENIRQLASEGLEARGEKTVE
jgi:hypothetical protein